MELNEIVADYIEQYCECQSIDVDDRPCYFCEASFILKSDMNKITDLKQKLERAMELLSALKDRIACEEDCMTQRHIIGECDCDVAKLQNDCDQLIKEANDEKEL